MNELVIGFIVGMITMFWIMCLVKVFPGLL